MACPAGYKQTQRGRRHGHKSRKPDNRTDLIATPETETAARNAACPLRSPLALQFTEARAAGALGKRRGERDTATHSAGKHPHRYPQN
ncbi:hypothetical protein AAA231_22395 [Bacteroides cellulosilyticus]